MVVPNRHFKKAGALHLQTQALRIFQVGKDLRRSVVQPSVLGQTGLLRAFSCQVVRTSKDGNQTPVPTLNLLSFRNVMGVNSLTSSRPLVKTLNHGFNIQTSIELPEHSSLAPIQLKHPEEEKKAQSSQK